MRRASWRRALALSAAIAGTLPASAGAGIPAVGQDAAEVDPQAEVQAVSVHWRTGRPVGWTGAQELSDDGRMVLFDTEGPVIPDPPEFGLMLYARDMLRGTTEVVNARTDGTVVPGSSWTGMGLSGDGRFAGFAWSARELSPTGKHPEQYAYVKNLRSGHLDALRAHGSAATRGKRPSYVNVKEISRHGRYLAGNGSFDLGGPWGRTFAYLLDRRTGTWTWICPPGGDCHVEGMSDNGRYLAYYYNPDDGPPDYYFYDRVSGQSRRIPRGPIGDDWVVFWPLFSGNSRIMVVDWVNYDTGKELNVLYRTSDLRIIAVLGREESMGVNALSHTGRYLAVSANPDRFRWSQSYRYDRRTGEFVHLSVNAAGEPANYWSLSTGISADGRTVVFNSGASNLVPGDQRLGSLSDSANWDSFLATVEPPEPPCPPWACPPPPPR